MIYKKAKVAWEFIVIVAIVVLLAYLILKSKGQI